MKARQQNLGTHTHTGQGGTRPKQNPTRLKALKIKNDHPQEHQFSITKISGTVR